MLTQSGANGSPPRTCAKRHPRTPSLDKFTREFVQKLRSRGAPESLINQWLERSRTGRYGMARRLLRRWLAGKTCGVARRSDGLPCISRPVPGRSSCRYHGGAGGPKTPEGIERCRQAALERWRRKREAGARAATTEKDPWS